MVMQRFKTLWGSGESRVWKFGAWATALGLYGGYEYYHKFYADKRPLEMRERAAAAKK